MLWDSNSSGEDIVMIVVLDLVMTHKHIFILLLSISWMFQLYCERPVLEE